MKRFALAWSKLGLVGQILIGLLVGIAIAVWVPGPFKFFDIFGNLFVSALKAIAPLMVFILVMAAVAQQKAGQGSNMKTIVFLYIVGTMAGGACGVLAGTLFPTKLELVESASELTPPDGILEVLQNILFKIVENPVSALMNANFLGVLVWSIILGIGFRLASDNTKNVLSDCANAITKCVRFVIKLAPIGIMGLVYTSITTSGLKTLLGYGHLILVLVVSMFFVAFVINPLIIFLMIHKNPYPLVWKCIRVSGLTAFFMRSGAANIPVNLELCQDLGLDADTYSISIPLGATINMAGAAITIAVMSMAACYTEGVSVDFPSAILLVFLASASAAGASGVPGGSLLLIPLACSLFGLPGDISMQVIGVGFIVGVIQDSCETALNSSTDVLFTAATEIREARKHGKEMKLNI